jgi:copper chaperone CopZ
MIHKNYQIPNISCGHCVATIERELKTLPGIQNIVANAGTKNVSLDADSEDTLQQVESLLVEIGYPPAA